MLLLDGQKVSSERRARLMSLVQDFTSQFGVSPKLVVVLIGEDPASQVYTKNKVLACQKIGMRSTLQVFPVTTHQDEIISYLQSLNEDLDVDGVLLQLPLPQSLDKDKLINVIAPEKDVDGLTVYSVGRLFMGKPLAKPCTPKGIMAILKYYQVPVRGRRALVIGRSDIVGKPMAHLLLAEDATPTIAHSKTDRLAELTRDFDLVIVAAGRPEFFGKEFFRPGQTVVDVGIHRLVGTEGVRLTGDVNFSEVRGLVNALTPVPGGVGPMTITSLLENTLELGQARRIRI